MSTSVKSAPAEDALRTALPRYGMWPAVAWFALLLLISYGTVVFRLADQWMTDPDMSHGPFVVILVGYLIWQRRRELAAAPIAPSNFGLIILVFSALILCSGPPDLTTYAFLTRVGLGMAAIGIVLYLSGIPTLALLAYPLIISILALPLPGFLLDRITIPLQFIASAAAEHTLDLFGVSVLREGNILYLKSQTLSVEEACSGIRSLMSLFFLGQTYIYLFDSRPWMRAVIAMATVPIAVIANAGRIVATGILGRYNPAWAEGIFHESTGWIIFAIAFIVLVVGHVTISFVCDLVRPRRSEACLTS